MAKVLIVEDEEQVRVLASAGSAGHIFTKPLQLNDRPSRLGKCRSLAQRRSLGDVCLMSVKPRTIHGGRYGTSVRARSGHRGYGPK
jgi:hypothetical protein